MIPQNRNSGFIAVLIFGDCDSIGTRLHAVEQQHLTVVAMNRTIGSCTDGHRCMILQQHGQTNQLYKPFAPFALGDHFACATTIPVLSNFLHHILLTLGSDDLTLSVTNLVLQDKSCLNKHLMASGGGSCNYRSHDLLTALIVCCRVCMMCNAHASTYTSSLACSKHAHNEMY